MLSYQEQRISFKLLWLYFTLVHFTWRRKILKILLVFLYFPQSEKLNYTHDDNNLN